MSKLPYFPFYPDDWISSPSVMLMTMEQRGIYITLLAHAWNFPGGALPDDMSVLQRFCHGAKSKNITYVLDTCFVRRADLGVDVAWTNPRMLSERSKVIEKRQKASESVKHTKRYIKAHSNDDRTIIERSSAMIIYPEPELEPEPKESKTIVQKEALNEGFKIFWKAYPRKQGKEPARKKWLSLKPDPDLAQDILNALGLQCLSEQWTKDNGQFIPLPATWLNQKRWEDEVVLGEDMKTQTASQKFIELISNSNNKIQPVMPEEIRKVVYELCRTKKMQWPELHKKVTNYEIPIGDIKKEFEEIYEKSKTPKEQSKDFKLAASGEK